MVTGGSLNEIFTKRAEALAANICQIHDGSEALHQTRVASRRLREVIPLLPSQVDTEGKLERDVRRLTRRLGRLRELDVLSFLIRDFGRDGRHSPAALAGVSSLVQELRESAREGLAVRLPQAKLERLIQRLMSTAKNLRWTEERGRHWSNPGARRAWLWALDARVSRRGADVRSAIHNVGSVYSPRLHEVRIALKKFRYALELDVEARQLPLTGDLTLLKAGQDVLGHLHDLEGLIECSRQAQVSLLPDDLRTSRQLKLFVRAVEDQCRNLHGQFMRDRSGLAAITRRNGTKSLRPLPAVRRAAG